VQSAVDVERVRELPTSDPRLSIVKIERRAALENIDSILQSADGIMVARGSGVELPLERFHLPEKLISKANYYGKPARRHR
jgi:pyruvate kinase